MYRTSACQKKNARGAVIEANTRSRDNVIFTFDLHRNTGAVDRVARIGVLSNYTSTRHISRLLVEVTQLNQRLLYADFCMAISMLLLTLKVPSVIIDRFYFLS